MALRDRLKKATKSEYAAILSEDDTYVIRDWIDTGNYALNTLISGDPFKGFPSGRILQLAGPNSTGKTFINLEIVRIAQSQGWTVVYYDTEMAQDKNSFLERGIDIENLIYVPIDTVEKLSTSLFNILEEVEKDEKVMIVVDSIGNLSTIKEITDIQAENDKRDMTRAQKLKALFRTVTLRCGLKHVPLIGVNHVYASVGSFFPSNTVGGGSGSLYASSCIVELSKAQDKKGTDVVGAIITCKSIKNRFAKEKQKIKININFNVGLDPYSGLLALAEEHGILPKTSTGRYLWKEKKLTKAAASKPEVMDEILHNEEFLAWLRAQFKYGTAIEDEIDNLETSQDETVEAALGSLEDD